MSFRKKRMFLLTSIAILLMLSILDIWIQKVEIVEAFGKQFFNEQKTEKYNQTHKAITATAERQLEIKRQDIKEVLLSSIGGKVSVKRSDDHAIRLQYTVTVSAADMDAVHRKLDTIKIEEEIQNGKLTLVAKANGKSIDNNSISIDYILLIPDERNLQVENEDGAVYISGIHGNVKVSSDRGIIAIYDMHGNLSVKSSNGSIYMSNITGNIELENRYSIANIDQAKGTLEVNNRSSRNFINHIEGKVTGAAELGSLYLRDIKGPVEVVSRDSNIQLDQIEGHISVTSEYGINTFILSEEEGYTLSAAVSGSGHIQTQLPLPIEEKKDGDYKTQMNGIVGDGTWNLDVKSKSGDIIFYSK